MKYCVKRGVAVGLMFLVHILFSHAQAPNALYHSELDIFSRPGAGYLQIDSTIDRALDLRDLSPDSGLHLLERMAAESGAAGYPPGKARALLYIANIHVLDKGDITLARRYLNEAWPFILRSGKSMNGLLRGFYTCMGRIYFERHVFDSTLSCYYKALDFALAEEVRNWPAITQLYNHIGSIHLYTDQYEKGLFYVGKAKALARRHHIPYEQFVSDMQLSSYYILKGQLDSAGLYLSEKYKDWSGERMDDQQFMLHYNKGSILLRQYRYTASIPYFRKALLLGRNNPIHGVFCMNSLGLAFMLTGSYDSSRRYLHMALGESLRSGVRIDLANIYNNLSGLYDSLGQYKQALMYKTLFAALQDSLNKIEKVRVVNELETRYRTTEKDRAIALQQLQLAAAQNRMARKNLLIIIIIAGSLIVFLSMTFVYQRQRLQIEKGRTLAEQHKVNLLRTTIDAEERERSRIGRQLHDDVMVEFSIIKMKLAALPARYREIRQADSYTEIEDQFDHAIIKLRQTAHNLMPDALLESGMVAAIGYFCQGVQKTTGIAIEFQHYGVIPRLPADTEVSLYRIVQELIQNVIKHAAAKRILIQVSCRQQYLALLVEDDGAGIQDVSQAESGMGLKSIRSRLAVMQGTMEIAACAPHGTSVHIELKV